jgi:hypothetical protein
MSDNLKLIGNKVEHRARMHIYPRPTSNDSRTTN